MELRSNTGNNPGPQSPDGCVNARHVSWVVTSNQAAGPRSARTRTCRKFNIPPLSSFTTITSTFAETSPHVGIYEYAYDVWLNGVARGGSTQILVWVDNYHRVPAGTQ